ncbi:hypothetical protein [Thermospira aquatica]|uniref:Uncharacterized protein n=1 Tax=Thermospira aquatica TaxID=2828656 RepID=A0AAX3BDV0_9SPIR|nr:hypothetical protein [Thermospira aquatica]URA10224.1 hypothetical protein KDW03_12225 [Thermospira aquatica]
MGVLPIDFQVLFSKIGEHSELVARQQQVSQSGQIQAREQAHQKSIEINHTVSQLDAYAQDFTKVDPEASSSQSYEQPTKQSSSPQQTTPEKHEAPLEEGKGQIIDIID